MSLLDLQEKFMTDIQAPFSSPGETETLIIPAGRITPREALNVYRNNTLVSREKSLESTYEVCLEVVGAPYFHQAAADYARTYPPSRHDLNLYGESFPAYLENLCRDRPELADFRYLPDLARLEWAWNHAFYAPDDRPFDFDAFGRIPEARQGDIHFLLGAALTLLSSPYPIHNIWDNHKHGRPAAEIPALSEAQQLLIFRKDLRPAVDIVSRDAFSFLSALQNGSALRDLTRIYSGPSVTRYLQEFIQKKWVAGFFVDKSS